MRRLSIIPLYNSRCSFLTIPNAFRQCTIPERIIHSALLEKHPDSSIIYSNYRNSRILEAYNNKDMNMTLTEQIIAKHAGKRKVIPGEIVDVDVDCLMINDATITHTIDIFKDRFNFKNVWDSEKIILINDHQVPADSVNTAEVHQKARKFALEQGIKLYENEGVCHQVMLESHVKPGDLVIGADSHTCSYGCIGAVSTGMGSTDVAAIMGSGKTWLKVPETIHIILKGKPKNGVYAKDIILHIIGELTASGASYRTMEFSGETVRGMTISERFTLCNMVIEAGGKSAMIIPDERVTEMFGDHHLYQGFFLPAENTGYAKTMECDVSNLNPKIACPHSVDNIKDVKDVEGIKIDQAFLGACTNGRIDDLRIAAKILKNRKVYPGVRMLVTPASVKEYTKALKEGIIDIFIKAGATVNHPGCSTCWGACQGVLGRGQKMISSANRNFKGRTGSPESEIYLASPATVAASAIRGRITGGLK